jgi:hypothetical protein
MDKFGTGRRLDQARDLSLGEMLAGADVGIARLPWRAVALTTALKWLAAELISSVILSLFDGPPAGLDARARNARQSGISGVSGFELVC